MHGASDQKKVTSATAQYNEAYYLYKDHFGNPNKLFKFNPRDAEKVRGKAELVLVGLAKYARSCIEQKDVKRAKKIMQLFSWADYIRLETMEKKNVHPDTFELWESIRKLK